MTFLKGLYQRSLTILFMILLIIILTVISVKDMAVNLLPDIAFPYLAVKTEYIGASAEIVDKEVTRPLESSISQLDGIHEISTYSVDNGSIIIIDFEYGTNIEKKTDLLNNKINEVTLPSGAGNPQVTNIDLNGQSLYSLTIYSETKSMEEVYKEALLLKNNLTSISGVGSVKLSGAPDVKVNISCINGLEMFVGLLVEDLKSISSLDIPLGEISVNGDRIIINNYSKADSIDVIKDTTIGLELTNSQVTTFKGVQETIKNIEKLNVEDTEKLKSDADDINKFIDELLEMTDEELDDLVDGISTFKSMVSLIENYSAPSLNLMWSTTLKPLFENEDFKNMSEEDLHKVAEDLGVSYDLLKWLQDNSDIDPDTGKTYAEIKWKKIVKFREEHPDEILDSDYPSLFYDIELVSNDSLNDNYMSEEDIIDGIKLSRNINTVGLNNVVDKLKEDEEISDNEYAAMFIYSGNEYDIPLTGMTIDIIRDKNFEYNYQIFHDYKINHCHDEEELDDEDNPIIRQVGDDIPSADFVALYNQMKFENEFEMKPTIRNLDFIRDVSFSDSNILIKVSQMADVYISTSYSTSAYYNSNQAIQLDIYGAGKANATKIAGEAKKIIAEYNLNNTDYNVISLNNQADFINDSLSNAIVSLIIGSVLAIIVIYLFLRKVKSSLIIAVSMPLSVFMTLICLKLMNITLNMVSIGGIAVGIGMLVDNSIVVLESITSEKEKGKNVLEASISGVKLVIVSLIGSTLTSICVFFPILFINGLTKEIFADLAWSVIFSLSFSLIVAVTVIPTLFCFFYKKEEKNKEVKTPIFDKINEWYIKFLKGCLKKKGITIVVLMVVFVLSGVLVFTSSIEFLPSIDQHKLQINVKFENGSTDLYCQEKTMEAYNIIMNNIDDIKYMSSSVGFSGMIQTDKTGTIIVEMKEDAKKTKSVIDDIRDTLENKNFDCDYSIVELDGVVASLTGGMSGVSVNISGDNVDTLIEIAGKIEQDVIKKKGIKHASDNMISSSVSYNIKFDQDRIASYGLDYQTIVMTLRVGLAGYDIYEITESDTSYMVSCGWTDNTIGSYYDSIDKLIIGINSDNEFIHLNDVAEIEEETGRHVIRKVNGKDVLQINVETSGIDTNVASKYLQSSTKDVLKDYKGYTFLASGVSYYLTDAFSGLVVALVISFFLLIGVMTCLFESLKKPFIIIFSFPFAFAGGFIALALFGVSLNVVSFIGLIMLMGVIINDAIVLNERFDQLYDESKDYQYAVVEGCRQRLRAVLMTTLTTVLALIPMALGIGKGAELMQPLGVVAIGGMFLGTIVTLILIPCVYSVFYKVKYDKK